MDISLKDADGHWAELIQRAERGEQIVLLRDGISIAQLGPPISKPQLTPAERQLIIDEIVAEAGERGLPGPDAAHSADHLYDEFGLPW
jgi:antitoxin (DNA-binding transcriptional repressor) of toxin-antitoxin stability system